MGEAAMGKQNIGSTVIRRLKRIGFTIVTLIAVIMIVVKNLSLRRIFAGLIQQEPLSSWWPIFDALFRSLVDLFGGNENGGPDLGPPGGVNYKGEGHSAHSVR